MAAPPSVPPRRSSGGFLTQYFLFILFGFGLVTLWMNSRHEGINPMQVFQNQHFSVASLLSSQHYRPMEPELIKAAPIEPPEQKGVPVETMVDSTARDAHDKKQEKNTDPRNENQQKEKAQEDKDQEDKAQDDKALEQDREDKPNDGHKLAGLDCSAYGGPTNEKAAEMVYWSDIPSDNAHVSPFYDEHKFMTFEPDQGGWNNIRMSMETVLAMAVATGRTLVLPPEQRMYLLDTDKHRHHVSRFEDSFLG